VADEIGTKICSAVKGESCKGTFFDTSFFRVAGGSASQGQAALVTLEDPVSLGTDNRQFGIFRGEDPDAKIASGFVAEGESVVVGPLPSGDFSVWLDSVVPAKVEMFSSVSAAQGKKDNQDSTFIEQIRNDVKEQADKAQKRADNVLIGVFALAAMLVVGAVFVLPQIKIPKVGLG
jgi:hypothetical protein